MYILHKTHFRCAICEHILRRRGIMGWIWWMRRNIRITQSFNLSTLTYIFWETYVCEITRKCVILCDSLNLNIIRANDCLSNKALSWTINLQTSYWTSLKRRTNNKLYMRSIWIHHTIFDGDEKSDNLVRCPILIRRHGSDRPLLKLCIISFRTKSLIYNLGWKLWLCHKYYNKMNVYRSSLFFCFVE